MPPATQTPFIAYAQLALSMFTVGLCVTAGKAATEHLPVVVLAGVRCFAAALALWPLARRERARVAMNGRDRRDLFLQALFGVFGFTLLMLGGVRLTGATEAGLIAATMPLAILVLAMPMLGEGLSPRALRAALIASLGIALVSGLRGDTLLDADTLLEHASPNRSAWLGNMLVVGAVVCEALYTIFAKRLASRLPPATMALRLNLLGLLLFAPLLPFQPWGAVVEQAPAWVWGLGALYGVGTSAVALVLWYRGTQTVRGGTAGLFTVFLPLGAMVSATLFLGETIAAHHVAGGLVIALALAIGLSRGGGGVRPWLRRPRV